MENKMSQVLEIADELKLEELEERLEFMGCWWEVATGHPACLVDPR
jgi:hypothetical protein